MRPMMWLLLGMVGCSAAAAPAREPQRASLRWKPGASVVQRECPATPSVDDVAAARERCEQGDVAACGRLLEQRDVTEGDARMARDHLASACRRDPVCGCAAYGAGLAWDRQERFDGQAIETSRVACVRGALTACDEISTYVDMCEQGLERPLCAVLREAGRAKPVVKPPRVGAVQLPPALTGCFAVARVPAPPSSDPFQGSGPICEIDPAACPAASF